MADLPQFTSISELPCLIASEIESITRPTDLRVAEAETRCGAGDDSVLPLIETLVQEGNSAHTLQTCLPAAVKSTNNFLVQQLLYLGATVNIDSVRIAINAKALSLLSLFVRYGWDINKEVEWCYPSPLSLAVGPEVDIDEQVVSWFLANGADPDALCGMDITPLSLAVQYAPFQIILKLLESSGSARNGQLLHHAAWRTLDDCGEVCHLILERCEFGINDMMYKDHALSYETRKIVGLGTPLHEAARAGRPETVRVLLDHGADLTALDSDGFTVFEVAMNLSNESVAQCLRDAYSTQSNL